MISEMHENLTPQLPQEGSMLFDWQLDIQRLEREADEAAAAGAPDPWALVEAECSLDLIDAELLALNKGDPRQTAATVQHLKRWRLRTEAVLLKLRQLEETSNA
jgi:hypothetical protein